MTRFGHRLAKWWGVSLRDRRLLVALAVAYGFARTAGGTLPYLLLYTLGITAAVCALWVRSLSGQVVLGCEPATRRLKRGDDLRVELRLYNEGFLPAPWLEVEDPSGTRSFRSALGPLASLRLSYRQAALRRGRYRPGPFVMTVADPFGFFHARHEIGSPYPVTVYPPVHRWEADYPLAQPFGRLRTRRPTATDASSLAAVRDFRTGDNPRHIDWKSTARRQRLQVREFELTATGLLSVYLDLYAETYTSWPVEELAVDAAASLCAAALQSGLDLRLMAHGPQLYHLPAARGAAGVRACLELLVDVKGGGRVPLAALLAADAPRLPPGSSVAVITAVVEPALGQLLLGMAAGGRPVAVFVVGDGPAGVEAARLAREGLGVFMVDARVRAHRLRPRGGGYRARAL